MKNIMHGPITLEQHETIGGLTVVPNPETLTAEERCRRAKKLGDLVAAGVFITLSSIDPRTVGAEAIAHASQVQRGVAGS
jgi:hypothetical protein